MRVNTGGSGSAGDTKVYESESLIAAAKAHANHYQTLRNQFQTLRSAFTQITNLGSNFQGQGAESIKNFYAAQVNVVDAWLRLIDKQIAYYHGVAGTIDDKNLGGNTHVQVPFLDEDLSRGYVRAKEMITDQREEIAKILGSISDLVPIHTFSNHDVDQALDAAEEKRAKMVLDVQDLDQNLTNEYQQITEDLPNIKALYEELIHATQQGADVQPMHFNAQAYHDSKIYKVQDEMAKEAQKYLKTKKQQEKARKVEKESSASLFNNLPIDQKIELLQVKLNYGAGKATMDMVTGVGYMFQHPIRTAEALMRWNQTSGYLGQGIHDSFEKNMVHGDPLTRAQWIGYAAATIASFFIGTKGIDKVSRAGKVAEAAELTGKGSSAAKTISKVAGKSGKIDAGGMSEETLQTLIEAAKAGNLPYNVINTAKIKKQLMVTVQESKRDYSYDLVSQIQKQKEAAAFKIKIKNVGNKPGRSMPDEDPEQLARMLQTQIAAAKVGKLPYNVINTAKLRKQLLFLAKEPGGDDSYDLLNRIQNQKQAVAVGEVHWETNNGYRALSKAKKIEVTQTIDYIDFDPYRGIKEASEYLKKENVPRSYRKQILESFVKGTIKLQIADYKTYGLRFYGGENKAIAKGRYLIETFTNLTNRENLALPFEWNEMTNIAQFKIKEGTIMVTGVAGPQLEEGARFVGGSRQLYINNLEDLIRQW